MVPTIIQGAPMPCPCQSGLSYAECCQPFHEGRAQAPTAEAL
ncbi:MAG: SEC-C metal-binding domain-containing protein, partial [Thiolinea sp.]